MITSMKKGCLSSKEKGNEGNDIVEKELCNEWVDHPQGRTSESMQGAYAKKCEDKDLEPEEEIISMFDEFWRDVFGGEYEGEGYDRGKHHIQQREDIINQQRAHIQQLQQSLDECYKRIQNLEASLQERDTSQDPSYSHTLTNKTVESKYDSDSGGSGELYSSEEEASTEGGESDMDRYCDIREGKSVDTSEMERDYENEEYNQQATQTEFRQFNSDNWWSVDNKPICYYCKKVGHKHWRCRDRWREKRKIKRRSWKVKQIEEEIHQLQHQIKQHETHNLEQTQEEQLTQHYNMKQINTQHNEQQEQQNQQLTKQELQINAICREAQWLQQKYALNEAYKHGYFDCDTGNRYYPTYSLDTFFPE